MEDAAALDDDVLLVGRSGRVVGSPVDEPELDAVPLTLLDADPDPEEDEEPVDPAPVVGCEDEEEAPVPGRWGRLLVDVLVANPDPSKGRPEPPDPCRPGLDGSSDGEGPLKFMARRPTAPATPRTATMPAAAMAPRG